MFAESQQLGDEAAPRQGFDGQKAAEHQPKIEHERQDEGAPTSLAKFVDRGFAAQSRHRHREGEIVDSFDRVGHGR